MYVCMYAYMKHIHCFNLIKGRSKRPDFEFFKKINY